MFSRRVAGVDGEMQPGASHPRGTSHSQLHGRHHDGGFGIQSPDRRRELGGAGPDAKDPPHVSRTSVWFMALLYFNLQRWLLAVLFDEVARVD
jgi:hypothetical protein